MDGKAMRFGGGQLKKHSGCDLAVSVQRIAVLCLVMNNGRVYSRPLSPWMALLVANYLLCKRRRGGQKKENENEKALDVNNCPFASSILVRLKTVIKQI